MITLYHGCTTPTANALAQGEAFRLGTCFAESATAAATYAYKGSLVEIEIDLSGLIVTEVAGYDRDSDTAPGDRDLSEFAGIDVLVYEDEDLHGREHTTYRLISNRALERVRIIDVHDSEDAECL